MATIKTSNGEFVSSGLNHICADTKVIGKIETTGDIRIDGMLDGSLVSNGRIVVGGDGVISGDLTCDCLDISGKLEGKIVAKNTLVLKNNSVVNGDIFVQKLIVESGALFNGTCKMQQSAENQSE